jgi:hypothetical protein
MKKKKLTVQSAVGHNRLGEGGFLNLRGLFGVVVLSLASFSCCSPRRIHKC